MTAPDPFDTGVPRVAGRPQIIPLNGRGKPDLKKPLVEYQRASDISGALDDGYGLRKWLVRHAVVGMAISPDLCAMAGALGRNPDELDRAGKATLDEIADRAHDRSGGNVKADYGTAIHSLTEPGNTGVVPEHMAADVAAYGITMDEAGLVVEETETFVVNDELKVAGTFDHVYRFTKDVAATVGGVEVTVPAGTKVIGDKKTGALHIDQHGIQLATYARGKAYDHVTGERTALDVSPKWGVVAHIPREDGKAVLHLIDLHEGWEGAKLAVAARAYNLGARKRMSAAFASYKVDATPTPPAAPPAASPAPEPAVEQDPTAAALDVVRAELGAVDAVLEAIRASQSVEECRALWRRYHLAWTEKHTDAVRARCAELGAAA